MTRTHPHYSRLIVSQDGFHAAVDLFEDDPDAQVAILSGRGKSFSAGIDMTGEDSKKAEPWQYHEAFPRNGISVFKPIVGAIQGYALGQ